MYTIHVSVLKIKIDNIYNRKELDDLKNNNNQN